MPLNPKQLADDINKAIGATDKDGNKIKTTVEMQTLSTAIITTLQAGGAFFPPGTVTGTAGAPAAPIPDLKAENGTFLPPLLPTNWITLMSAPGSDPSIVVKRATNSVNYLQASVNLKFEVGTITGVSTATPSSPGNLVAGGSGGKITGLDGGDWAKAILGPKEDLGLVTDIYSAVVDHIQNNAIVNFLPPSMTGAFASPGAPLVGGTAQGGVIL